MFALGSSPAVLGFFLLVGKLRQKGFEGKKTGVCFLTEEIKGVGKLFGFFSGDVLFLALLFLASF